MICAAPGERWTRPVASATSPESEGTGGHRCSGLQIDFYRICAGLDCPVFVAGHDLNLQRWKHGPTGDHRRQSGRRTRERRPPAWCMRLGFGTLRKRRLGCGARRLGLALRLASGAICSAGSDSDDVAGAGGNQNSRSLSKPGSTQEQKSQSDEHLPPLLLFRIIPERSVQLR